MNLLALIEKKIDSYRQVESSRPPVLIFDLDDTLIDCRHRKLQVFREFVNDAHFQNRFPESCQKLANIKLEQICFRVSDCLQQIGLNHAEFEQELHSYWRSCYFSNPYLVHDQPFPEAVDFVQKCFALGINIVYLTGRDEPGMGSGTRQRLRELGFPYLHHQVQLILKSDPLQSDLSFKQEALHTIDQIGCVIAAFENEVRNLNMMAEHYPNALMIYRQTLQSPNPPDPHPRLLLHSKF